MRRSGRMTLAAALVAYGSLLAHAQTPAAAQPSGQPASPAQPVQPAAPAPQDPIAGNWRGTLKSASGTESPLIITMVKKGDGYTGTTNGLTTSADAALKRVTVAGTQVSIEASDDSKLGTVTLAGDLAAEGNQLQGAGTLAVGAQKFDVTFALHRRPRADAIQPHVGQSADYFVGRWKFEYIGAE